MYHYQKNLNHLSIEIHRSEHLYQNLLNLTNTIDTPIVYLTKNRGVLTLSIVWLLLGDIVDTSFVSNREEGTFSG